MFVSAFCLLLLCVPALPVSLLCLFLCLSSLCLSASSFFSVIRSFRVFMSVCLSGVLSLFPHSLPLFYIHVTKWKGWRERERGERRGGGRRGVKGGKGVE